MASSAISRETIGAAGRPLTLIVFGALFLFEYEGGYAVSQTWPVILILVGSVLALQSFAPPAAPEPRAASGSRCKSLFGPLALMGAGAFLLASNLDPSLSLRGWFAAYWPWILIVWGGFRLLELLFLRGLGRPAPRAPGFGALALIALLVIGGTAARRDFERSWGLDIGFDGFESFEPSMKLPIDHASEVAPGATVVLHDLRGQVRVAAAGDARLRIQGSADLRARGNQLEAPVSLIEVERKGSEVWVRTREHNGIESRDARYDIDIILPQGAGLRSESRRARLVVKDVDRPIEVHAGRGKITLKRIGGAVRIEAERARRIEAKNLASNFILEGNTGMIDLQSVAGDVAINGSLLGTVRLAGVEGLTRVVSRYGEMEAAAVPGRVELKVRSVSGSGLRGGLRLHGDRWRRVHLAEIAGAADIRGRRMELDLLAGEGFGEIRAKVDKGDIRLQLPRNARFTVEARTDRGRARSFLGPLVRSARRGSSETLEGGTGGGPPIRLHTGRGAIVVETAGARFDRRRDAGEDASKDMIRGTRIAWEELRNCLPRMIRHWVESLTPACGREIGL